MSRRRWLDWDRLRRAWTTAPLYATAVVLLLPYSLARWDSGRHVTVGVVVLITFHPGRELLNGSPVSEILAGTGFLLFPVDLGAAVRFGVSARQREAEQVIRTGIWRFCPAWASIREMATSVS